MACMVLRWCPAMNVIYNFWILKNIYMYNIFNMWNFEEATLKIEGTGGPSNGFWRTLRYIWSSTCFNALTVKCTHGHTCIFRQLSLCDMCQFHRQSLLYHLWSNNQSDVSITHVFSVLPRKYLKCLFLHKIMKLISKRPTFTPIGACCDF